MTNDNPLAKDKTLKKQVIAKVALNILVLASEVRVVTTMFALTSSWVTAVLSLAGTGAMFILWYDVLAEHPLSNRQQKGIVTWMTFWSLVVGAFFVFADFAVKVRVNGTTLVNINFLIGLLAVSTLLNVVMLLFWLGYDNEIGEEKALALELAAEKYSMRRMRNKEISLTQADATLSLYHSLQEEWGDEALAKLGVEAPTLANVHSPKVQGVKSGGKTPKSSQ